ncbi:MAG: prepilin peptidase [Verrucomicrobiota bacterium]
MSSVASVCAAAFGLLVGSFLNVCIYRLPRGISVNNPRRSFCPRCERLIPWFENVPVFSWLLLRGRCAGCQRPISARYVLVELIAAVLFAAITLKWGTSNWAMQAAYAVLVSLLIVATFVDLEHLIIPDEVTWGGVAAGLLLAPLVPAMHGSASPLASFVEAALGAVAGYGLLWAVAEGGRLVFGRRKFQFEPPVALLWVRRGDEAQMEVDGETLQWGELFVRGSEKVTMQVVSGVVDGKAIIPGLAIWQFERLKIGDLEMDLNAVETGEFQISELTLPREVMGYGDVKFLAAIGAFLGWKSVLFTVMAASVGGAAFGILSFLLGKREWAAKIPFGPYLALGALLWLLRGPELVVAYWQWTQGLNARI